MTPTPFCCDITSGSVEERNEFIRLHRELCKMNNFSTGKFSYCAKYYGTNKDRLGLSTEDRNLFKQWFNGNILPLSEGIAILKEMVGEEEKETTYTEQEIDFAYLAGVFNVSGIDGLYNEIQRLKSLGKNPHDIIIEGRNQQPKP